MTIETRFNEGDKIFFISNKKAIESVVREIKIHRLQNEKDVYHNQVLYLCNKDGNALVNIKVEEDDAFASKEDLLKSL